MTPHPRYHPQGRGQGQADREQKAEEENYSVLQSKETKDLVTEMAEAAEERESKVDIIVTINTQY